MYSLAQALLVPAAVCPLPPDAAADRLVAEPAAQVAGALAVALGVALMAAGVRDIGANFQFFPEPRPAEEHSLTTGGVMGVVRHPQYAGTLAFCWGIALVTGAAPSRLLALLATTAALRLNADLEDAIMAERYGDAAAEYQRRVPAMVPRDAGALLRALLQPHGRDEAGETSEMRE